MRVAAMFFGLLSLASCGEMEGSGAENLDDSTSFQDDTVDVDMDGFFADEDCDDTDEAIHPDAFEVCDAIDNDCDGLIDDDDDSVDVNSYIVYFDDQDGDGYGNADTTQQACDAPVGFVSNDTDCDDSDGAINPEAQEVCDEFGFDEDCDGLVDDDDDSTDESGQESYFLDYDGDGFGDPKVMVMSCESVTGYVEDASDCDDSMADVHPGGNEICDAADVDEDCDGFVDDGDDSVDVSTFATYFVDDDGDGFGDVTTVIAACDPPMGFTVDATDCDDSNGQIAPDVDEVLDDEFDNDCDGFSSETVFFENFDAYSEGDLIAEVSPDFTTWNDAPGSGEDAFVLSTISYSPNNALRLQTHPTASVHQDIFVPVQPAVTSGWHEVHMKLFVSLGQNGYFNIQESNQPGINWKAEVFLADNGMYSIHGGGVIATGNYTQDQWIDVAFVAGLDLDYAAVIIEGVIAHDYVFSTGADGTQTLAAFGGVNLYANVGWSFYIDDFALVEMVAVD